MGRGIVGERLAGGLLADGSSTLHRIELRFDARSIRLSQRMLTEAYVNRFKGVLYTWATSSRVQLVRGALAATASAKALGTRLGIAVLAGPWTVP